MQVEEEEFNKIHLFLYAKSGLIYSYDGWTDILVYGLKPRAYSYTGIYNTRAGAGRGPGEEQQ